MLFQHRETFARTIYLNSSIRAIYVHDCFCDSLIDILIVIISHLMYDIALLNTHYFNIFSFMYFTEYLEV